MWAARKILVLCGDCKITWPRLKWFHDSRPLLDSNFRLYQDEMPESRLNDLSSLAGLMESVGSSCSCGANPSKMSLLHAIQSTSGSQYTESHDRIYSILSMTDANEIERPTSVRSSITLDIDYDRSAVETFQDVAEYLMLKDGHYSLLSLDCTFGGKVDENWLPSWCPNWNLPIGTALTSDRSKINDHDFKFRPGITFKSRSLFVRGSLAGTVLSASKPFPVASRVSMFRSKHTVAKISLFNKYGEYEVSGDVARGYVVVCTSTYPRFLVLQPSSDSDCTYQYRGLIHRFYNFPSDGANLEYEIDPIPQPGTSDGRVIRYQKEVSSDEREFEIV